MNRDRNQTVSAEKPVPLLFVNDKGKFEVGEQATKIIARIRGKVAVVAIAGLYRTGKSYVLNRLLGRQHGFEIGNTVNACTKGIYTWGRPITLTNEYGEEVHLILMDTEGIGSFEQNQTHDAKIFSLSVLLSSFFIYNSMGVIDETALEKISFIANLTKHIHVHSPSGKDAEENESQHGRQLAPYFPQFMWLLRDFSLKLVDNENQPITPRQYLDGALTKLSSDKSKNEVRQVITSVFPYRDCFTLVRPVVDEEDLQNLDNVPYENLRDKFKIDVEVLCKKILGKVRPKLLFGQPINGSAFINLVQSYVDAINSGAVPTIRNAWESVSELENKEAVEEGLKAYIQAWDQHIASFPLDTPELIAIDEPNQTKAKDAFRVRALGEQKEMYLEQLEKKLKEEFEKISQKNDAASEKLCKELLTKLLTQIEERLKKEEIASTADLGLNWKEAIENVYLKMAKGKWKYSALSEFLLQRLTDTMIRLDQQLLEKLREEQTKEREQFKKDLRDERDEKKKLREDFDDARKDLKTQLDKTNSLVSTLQDTQESSKKRITELTAENEKLKSEVSQLKGELSAASSKSRDDDKETIIPTVQRKEEPKKKGKCVIQ